MFTRDKDRRVTAIIIEQRVDMRSITKETLRELNVQVLADLATIDEVLSTIHEVGKPDWIIMGFDADKKHGSIALAALTLREPELANVRISWLIGENERDWLYLGYAAGLLSHHKKPCTKAILKDEFQRLLAEIDNPKANEALIAAAHFRGFLTDNGDYKTLVSLERALMRRHPEEALLHIKLAEALILAEKPQEAAKILDYAVHLSDEIKLAVKQLRSLIGDQEPEPNQVFAEKLQHCLIVDSDDSACKHLQKILETLGAHSVVTAVKMDEALHAAGTQPPSLIIQEWKIQGSSGAGLLQKWRTKPETMTTPIIVASSLINPDDKVLLHEMGALFSITKPIHDQKFIALLGSSLSCGPSNLILTLERDFKLALLAGDKKSVQQLGAAIIGSSQASDDRKAIVKGELAYLEKKYDEAVDFAAQACRSDVDSVAAINLLGRALLKTGDSAGAMRCFEKAQRLSPKNIERLCSLAEIKSELGDLKEAESLLGHAKTIDSDATRVKQTTALVALKKGQTETAAAEVQDPGVLKGVIAYMNNHAVALAQSGKLQESLKLYFEAQKIVPESALDVRTSIHLNISLAQARLNRIPEAVAALESAPKPTSKRLQEKLQSFRKRFAEISKHGKFNIAASPVADSHDDVDAMVTNRICLHGLFQPLNPNIDKELLSALRNPSLGFDARDAKKNSADQEIA